MFLKNLMKHFSCEQSAFKYPGRLWIFNNHALAVIILKLTIICYSPGPGSALGLLLLLGLTFTLPELFLQRRHTRHQFPQLPVVLVRLSGGGIWSGILKASLQAEHQSLRVRKLHLQILHLLLQRCNISSCSAPSTQTRPPLGRAISTRQRRAQLEIVKFCTRIEDVMSWACIYSRYIKKISQVTWCLIHFYVMYLECSIIAIV